MIQKADRFFLALGAGSCDFRFKAGGEPLRVAELYPDRIRLADAD